MIGEVCSYERKEEGKKRQVAVVPAPAMVVETLAAGGSLGTPRQIWTMGCIHSGGRGTRWHSTNACQVCSQHTSMQEGGGFMDGEFWKIRVKQWSKDRQTTNISWSSQDNLLDTKVSPLSLIVIQGGTVLWGGRILGTVGCSSWSPLTRCLGHPQS